MNIRIIAGLYGGRKIEAPDSDNRRTKPMGERIRNALFNRIGGEIKDASVLDAFAGTGAIGFEALSRGAAKIIFVERDRVAQNILSKNIVRLECEAKSQLIRSPVRAWIDTYNGDKFDIIFADPPYHDLQLSTVSLLMGLLKPNGLMVLSHTGRSEVPIQANIVVVDNRSYGTAHLTSYRRVELNTN